MSRFTDFQTRHPVLAVLVGLCTFFGLFVGAPVAIFDFSAPPLSALERPPAQIAQMCSVNCHSVVVIGDSTGEFFAYGIARQRTWNVVNAARRGCPTLSGSHRTQLVPGTRYTDRTKSGDASIGLAPQDCDWRKYVPQLPAADAAIVITGPMMMVNYEIGHVGEPSFDSFLRSDYTALFKALRSKYRTVVFVSAPPSKEIARGTSAYWTRQDRADAFNSDLKVVASATGAVYVDYAAWFATQDTRTWRPDGAHLEGDGAFASGAWLISQLERTLDEANRYSAPGTRIVRWMRR